MTHVPLRPSPWLLLPAAMALFLLAYAHRDPLLPSICFLGIVGSYFHNWRATLPKRCPWLAIILGFAALFFLCLLYYWIWLLSGEGLTYFRRFWYKPWLVSTNVMLQAVMLVWIWHLPRRSSGLLFLCMGLIAISSGNLLPSSYGIVNLYALFGGACLLSLFVLSGAMNGGQGQPFGEQCRQGLIILTCIAIIGAGTWYVSTGLQHAGQLLDSLLAEFTSGSHYRDAIGTGDAIQIAHRRHVRLSRRVVATLSGSQSPVYLRTQVLTDYQHARWTTPPTAPRQLPLDSHEKPQRLTTLNQGRQTTIKQVQAFSDSDRDAGSPSREVRLHVNLQGAMPLPYNTTRFHTPKPLSCLLTAGAIVQCTPASQLTSYTFEPPETSSPISFGIGFALPSPSSETSSDLERTLQQALAGPEVILAQLRPMARQIVGGDAPYALAAAQRIQQHFRQHFAYSLHVNLNPALDPIVDFVRHRRPAYCEYFASGMALMLRAIGIPARVVGGFMVWEYNALLQQWIVRQRDAHAWVEVYDDQSQRWVGFDATPPFRQTQFSRTGFAGFLDQGRAWIELQLRTIIKRLHQIDFIAWFIRLRQLETWLKPLGSGLVIVLLLSAVYGLWRLLYRMIYRFFKRLRWPTRQRPPAISDPVQAEAQDCFARVTALLKQRGHPILPTETLEDYLQRRQSRDTATINGKPEGPQWAQSPSIDLDATCPDPGFTDAIADFSRAYHQLRFRPWPSASENRAIFLQQTLQAMRQAVDQMQQTPTYHPSAASSKSSCNEAS